MRSHRVWNEVHSNAYQGTKSFGGEFRQSVYVGSSASYSNHLADIECREIPLRGTDWTMFILYLDGEQVKRGAFNNKTKVYLSCPMNEQPIADELTAFIENYEAA